MESPLWITRDAKGDQLRALWFVEPALDEFETHFVPSCPADGNQECVVVSESVARKYLGRDLLPGDVRCLSVGKVPAVLETA